MKIKKILLCLTFFFLISSVLFAGTTGKIVGKITDQATGEPLPFANIMIMGTDIGAATNIDGEYIILNVNPGTYSLKASLVGFAEKIIEGVVVRVDLTSKVDFQLTEGSIEMDQVIVVAEKELIIKDVTSKTAVVSAETFTELPVASFQDVVSLQAGFVTGSSGELHARGGRGGEVVYLIDGVPTRDPLSASSGSELNKYSIQELQVMTGGFNAEYGQALSGVVNIVTKEGGNKFKARVEYTTDQINESPYRKADALALDQIGIDSEGNLVERVNSDGTDLTEDIPSAYTEQSIEDTPSLWPDVNIRGEFSTLFSGPVPFINKLKYFITGRYENSLAQTAWGYNKIRDINGKLTYSTGALKLNLNLQRTYRMYKPYSHAWKYYPQGYEDRKIFSWRNSLRMSHVLSGSTFYETSFSYNKRYYNRFTPGKYAEFTSEGELISSNYLSRTNNVPPFWTNADNGNYIKNEVKTFLFKYDISSQLNKTNLVKIGVEVRKYIIDRLSFEEPYASGFHAYEDYRKKPFEFSAYIQDKLEFDSFIINAGIRFDYVDVNDTRWESVDNPAGYIDSNDIWQSSGEVDTDVKTQISPRLGIAFPITDKTVFYSSYGHFFQIPDYEDMYTLRDPTSDGALVGNPGISAQKTIAFEVGVKQQVGSDFSLQVNAYFKDITNLVGSTYLTVFPYEYTIFDNSNYGGVQGFEISLSKRPSDFWFANLNYTYSIAKGNESDPREGYNDYRRSDAVLRPKRVFFLDFDRAHVLNASVGLTFPEKFGPVLGGFYPFENIDVNFIIYVASGLPYTPRPIEENDDLNVEKNSGRMPSVQQVDLRISKGFNLGFTKLYVFTIIDNLFDEINAVDVWSATGDAWDAGPTSSRTLDRQRNPANTDQRRSVKLGVRFDF
ncbi:MAG: TonB-dependent receptor [Ignavibacteria bacterium]